MVIFHSYVLVYQRVPHKPPNLLRHSIQLGILHEEVELQHYNYNTITHLRCLECTPNEVCGWCVRILKNGSKKSSLFHSFLVKYTIYIYIHIIYIYIISFYIYIYIYHLCHSCSATAALFFPHMGSSRWCLPTAGVGQ
jgi:hypothetical protein